MMRSVASALGVIAIAACSNPKVPPPSPLECFGERRAVQVTNNTTMVLDIWLRRAKNPAGSILGTSRPGFVELTLPPTAKTEQISFFAKRTDGTQLAPAFGNQRDYERVRYQLICDEAAADDATAR
jgi:hypothetical protein